MNPQTEPAASGKVRFAFLLGLTLCLGWLGYPASAHEDRAATTAPDDEASAAGPLRVARISENVWVHTSFQTLSNGQTFPANGLIVRHSDGLLLVDTAWGVAATEELLAWIQEHLDLPVTAALITHFHADSLGGAAALEAAGIPFFSSLRTIDLAPGASLPKPELLDGLANKGSVVEFRGIEVVYPGAAHSSDNVIVWVPGDKVLFGSCAVRSPTFPGRGNTADGSVSHWPLAMRSIRARYPDATIVVPGHGPPGTIDLLDHTIALFDTE